jgi:hypothetical protein
MYPLTIGHRNQISNKSYKKVYKWIRKYVHSFHQKDLSTHLIQRDDITSGRNKIEIHGEETLLHECDEMREVPSSQLFQILHQILV